MKSNFRKAALFAGVSAVAAGLAGGAHAQSVASVIPTSNANVQSTAQNNTNSVTGAAASNQSTTVSNVPVPAYGVQNSTVTVTSPTVNGAGTTNTATQSLSIDPVNQINGSGTAASTSVSTGAMSTSVGAGTSAGLGVYSAQSARDIENLANDQSSVFGSVSGAKSITVAGTNNQGVSASTLTVGNASDSATATANNSASTVSAAGANSVSASIGVGTAQRSVVESTASAATSNAISITGANANVPALSASTASVTGNAERATATGNNAATNVNLAGINSYSTAGTANNALSAPSSPTSASAGIAVATVQAVDAQTTRATVDNTSVSSQIGVTGDVASSTVANNANTLSATAQGNYGSNAAAIGASSISSGAGAGGVAAVASGQTSTGSGAIAQVSTNSVSDYAAFNTVTGNVSASSLSASQNDVLALSAANRTTNTLAGNAGIIGAANGSASADSGNVASNGSFAVASTQSATGTSSVASLTDSTSAAAPALSGTSIRSQISGNVTNASVVSDGNRQNAVAAGNVTVGAGNALSLSSSALSANAAVTNDQNLQGAVTAIVGAPGSPAVPGFTANFTNGVTALNGDFTATLVVNNGAPTPAQLAALTSFYQAQGRTFTYNAINQTALVTGTQSGTTGITATIPATAATPAAGGVSVAALSDVTASTLRIDGNESSGDAIGNSARNALAQTGSTSVTGSGANGVINGDNSASGVAALASEQIVANGSALTALVSGQYLMSQGTTAADDISASSLLVEGNSLAASVTGNTVDNGTAISGGSVETTGALVNSQDILGSDLVATLASGASASVTTTGSVANSTLAADGNAFAATITGNAGTNAVDVNASTAISQLANTVGIAGPVTRNGTFALSNGQDVIGADDVMTATAYGLFNVAGTTVGETVDDSTLSASGNTLNGAVQSNFADNSVNLAAGAIESTGSLSNRQSVSGTAATANAFGTGSVAVLGAVDDASVMVDGNAFSASSAQNTASNAINVSADGALATGAIVGAAYGVANGFSWTSTADYALASTQNAGAGVSSATATGSFSATAPVGAVADSSVSVSDNAVSADARSNLVENSVALDGNAIALSAALSSLQTTTGATTSMSDMIASAPATVATSVVSLDNNANSASSTANDATNSVAAVADTSLASRSSVSPYNLIGNGAGNADLILANRQNNTGAVLARAQQAVRNTLGETATTNGVTSSTVSLDGNTNEARALANRSTNALALSANTANATGGVSNSQSNSGSVDSNAMTTLNAAVTTNGVVIPSTGVSQSTVTLNGNSTFASAGGSNATNSLSVSATNVAAGVAPASVDTVGSTTTAAYAVLNNQGNSGLISASANVTYGAGFNGTADTQVANSAVALNGNSATAVGYGNAATNTLNLTALNGTAGNGTGPLTSSVASIQNNSGAVIVNATGLGNTAVGGIVRNSSVSMNGNATSASAFGNSSVTAATLAGTNLTVGN